MPIAQEVHLLISEDVLRIVRSRMASGGYSSESEVFEQAVLESNQSEVGKDSQLERHSVSDEWLRAHALPALRELEANPSTGMNIDQVRRSVEAERAAGI